MKKHVVICYDISSDVMRNRIAKVLLRYMIRTQLSVYEGFLSEAELQSIIQELPKGFDGSDSMIIYTLDNTKKKLIYRYGIDKNFSERLLNDIYI